MAEAGALHLAGCGSGTKDFGFTIPDPRDSVSPAPRVRHDNPTNLRNASREGEPLVLLTSGCRLPRQSSVD